MGLHKDVIYEVRTGGSDDNGGGFKSSAGGTDYSQQDAAQANGTNLTVDAVDNTKVAPDGHTPVAADVGNLIQITAGAGFTLDFYEITAQDGTSWTLDRSPAATGTSGGTWAMGGALGSPGKLTDAIKTDYQKAYIKSGTYTLTTATNGPAGPLAVTANIASYIEGYDVTRGDLIAKDYFDPTDNFPLISAGAQSPTYVVRLNGGFNDNRQGIACVAADANSNATQCFQGGTTYRGDNFIRCKAINAADHGFTGGRHVECYAKDCVTGIRTLAASKCYSTSNVNGFEASSNNTTYFDHCIAYANTGDGFSNLSYGVHTANCISVDNTSDGFKLASSYGGMDSYSNCIAYGNGAYGWNFSTSREDDFLFNCAAGNNTSGDFRGNNRLANLEPITLTADPFVDKASEDFRLNDTAGGGALLRGLCRVASQANDTGDIGATQHADGAGGGTTIQRITRRVNRGRRKAGLRSG